MRLLFCCEFYHPSRGGVQEVMRQIAERLVSSGHEVTVATTRLAERDFQTLNGVQIVEFDVAGNLVRGIVGEVKRYQAFLRDFDGDAIMIKAAQQWTFDAAWPVLDAIKVRKVFIPCGFSALYLPEYADYFRKIPATLGKFDKLIFYAEHYRDIDFARKHGLTNLVVLPNGASEVEFGVAPDPGFRERLGIPAEALVLLTVGTPINTKGHAQVAAAFAKLKTGDRPLSLILNGEWPDPKTAAARKIPIASIEKAATVPIAALNAKLSPRLRDYVDRAHEFWLREGARAFRQRALAALWYRSTNPVRRVGRSAGARLRQLAARGLLTLSGKLNWPSVRLLGQRLSVPTLDEWISEARSQPGKQALATNLPRADLVQAFLTADLFVFASTVEYSPLVLYEAAAAGTPFLTVPVGNAEEIVRWTGGGAICPAARDEGGYTRADPEVLAREIQSLLDDAALRSQLGTAGRAAWRREFNWSAIAKRYEAVLAHSVRGFGVAKV